METRKSWMTRPWLSVSRAVFISAPGEVREAAIAIFKAIPFRRAAHLREGSRERTQPVHPFENRTPSKDAQLIDARGPAAQNEAAEPEDQDDAAGDEEVIRHGMHPSGRITEILADPQQKNGGNDGELPGDDEKRVPQVAPLVQGLHL